MPTLQQFKRLDDRLRLELARQSRKKALQGMNEAIYKSQFQFVLFFSLLGSHIRKEFGAQTAS